MVLHLVLKESTFLEGKNVLVGSYFLDIPLRLRLVQTNHLQICIYIMHNKLRNVYTYSILQKFKDCLYLVNGDSIRCLICSNLIIITMIGDLDDLSQN